MPECIAILSNSVGTEDDFQYKGALATEREMHIPVIRHKQKKPACLDEVCFIFLFLGQTRSSTYGPVIQVTLTCYTILVVVFTGGGSLRTKNWSESDNEGNMYDWYELSIHILWLIVFECVTSYC